MLREPTDREPAIETLVAKVAALLTPSVPFNVRLEKVGLLVVPSPMAVAAVAALLAVNTVLPTEVPPRLVRVAARTPLSNCNGLVKVRALVPP